MIANSFCKKNYPAPLLQVEILPSKNVLEIQVKFLLVSKKFPKLKILQLKFLHSPLTINLNKDSQFKNKIRMKELLKTVYFNIIFYSSKIKIKKT